MTILLTAPMTISPGQTHFCAWCIFGYREAWCKRAVHCSGNLQEAAGCGRHYFTRLDSFLRLVHLCLQKSLVQTCSASSELQCSCSGNLQQAAACGIILQARLNFCNKCEWCIFALRIQPWTDMELAVSRHHRHSMMRADTGLDHRLLSVEQ